MGGKGEFIEFGEGKVKFSGGFSWGGQLRAAIQRSVRIKLLLAHKLVIVFFLFIRQKTWMTSERNLSRISLADKGGQVPQRQVYEISFPWSLTRRWAEPYKIQTLTKFYQEHTSLPPVQKYYCLCYLNQYNIEYQKCSEGLPNIKFKYKLQICGGALVFSLYWFLILILFSTSEQTS